MFSNVIETIPRSVYVHVPFCRRRCGYCNFTLIAGRDDLMAAYLDCLERELRRQLHGPHPVQTLFVGGGTPTHLPAEHLCRLLELLNQWLPVQPGGEYSCEANPLDCSPQLLGLLREGGVNRLSVGGQSFSDPKLQRLERDHSGRQLIGALELAAQYFENLSLDLIFASPGESLQDWQQDLVQALQLPLTHLSTYGLTIERGAAFYGLAQRGQLSEVPTEIQLEMYLHTLDQLGDHGWQHYEVSNFCLPGFQCRHNVAYWRGQSWLAFGPGAASLLASDWAECIDEHATARLEVQWALSTNHRSTTQYVKRLRSGQSPIAEQEWLDRQQVLRQRLVFGLRQLAGVDLRQLAIDWGQPVEPLLEPQLSRYLEQGWLELVGNQLRLTRAGLVVSDSLWPDWLFG
ncbi:MAG: radical SAM family heme chaperone HemW [Pirellulaceae bacterium]|nr:radical SAM family heme chaperone HemW [Pirellulaceae bacterium]